jgi:hypothetical protein
VAAFLVGVGVGRGVAAFVQTLLRTFLPLTFFVT